MAVQSPTLQSAMRCMVAWQPPSSNGKASIKGRREWNIGFMAAWQG
jgi:hypothetical protein